MRDLGLKILYQKNNETFEDFEKRVNYYCETQVKHGIMPNLLNSQVLNDRLVFPLWNREIPTQSNIQQMPPGLKIRK